jgi:hypothetical protein
VIEESVCCWCIIHCFDEVVPSPDSSVFFDGLKKLVDDLPNYCRLSELEKLLLFLHQPERFLKENRLLLFQSIIVMIVKSCRYKQKSIDKKEILYNFPNPPPNY